MRSGLRLGQLRWPLHPGHQHPVFGGTCGEVWMDSNQPRSWRLILHSWARAFSGAFVFGTPLLFTQELKVRRLLVWMPEGTGARVRELARDHDSTDPICVAGEGDGKRIDWRLLA